MNKKALSAIVATVALVLLTFAAIVIVLNFVVPFVKENLETGSECFPYRDYFEVEGFSVEFNSVCTIASYQIAIRARSLPEEQSEKVVGLKLSFIGGGSSASVIEISDIARIPGVRMAGDPNCRSNCQLFVPKNGEVRVYVYETDITTLNSVEIFPKLENGRICDKSDASKLEYIPACT